MIAAIVVAVTLPEFGYARTAVASELIGSTTVGNARARLIGKGFDTTGTHALATLHDHAVGTETDKSVVGSTQAYVRALSVVGALVCAGLHAVSEYL